MDNRNNHMDKWDYIVPFSSGALTASLDVLFIKDISLADAHTWGAEQTEKFVINTAKHFADFKGDNLAAAVTALENGAVKTNADNIAALQGLVGEGYEAIPEASIRGLFATS